MVFLQHHLGEGRLKCAANQEHPLGLAWQQWRSERLRDSFVAQHLTRAIAFAQALGPLQTFPTKGRDSAIRVDDRLFRNLVHRALLSEEEFEAVEFEATVASAYKEIVRDKIIALEVRDELTPDFEIDMGFPVAVEAKARSRMSGQNSRIEARVGDLYTQLSPAFERMTPSLAVRVTFTREPTIDEIPAVVERARGLIQAAAATAVAFAGGEIVISALDPPGLTPKPALPRPYGPLPHVPDSVFAYLTKHSPSTQIPRGWGKTSYRVTEKRDGARVLAINPRLLLIQVNVLPDNSKAIAALVRRARKQLPKDHATAVFVRATQFYSEDEPFRMGQALRAEFRNSKRIGAVVLWNRAMKIGEPSSTEWKESQWWQVVPFENPNADRPLREAFLQYHLPNRRGFQLMMRQVPRVSVFGPRRRP